MKLKNKIMLKHTDKLLLILTIFLFAVGLVMIFSSSNIAAFMRYNKSPYDFLLRQGVSLVAGLFIFLFLIHFSTKAYSAFSWLALLISFGLLIFVFFFGPIINDAKSWIRIGGLGTFQPSEFVKITIIVWYAAFFELKRHDLSKMFTNFFPLIVSAAIAGLVILQPDFGTAGIMIILSFMLYILMPINRYVKFKVVTISGLVMLVVLLGYYFFDTSSFQRQIERFDYRYPCSEEKFYTTGNQVCNSYIAFNNGGMWGKGLGNSTQKYLYLPESHTDFIFPIIVEEWGMIVGLVIIFLYMFILLYIK